MSESPPRRRIRAKPSTGDADVMGFILEAPVQAGQSARFDAPHPDAPLAVALFEIDGIARVEVSDATIWVQRRPDADWAPLKPAIANAIRQVLDSTDTPIAAPDALADSSDATDRMEAGLREAVETLLERQVNPAIASHGGHIAVDRVEGDTVFLRMSGGCQGCAASAATLRDGVERMLRNALPEIGEIVDVTDHASGDSPFYARDTGPSPALLRPVPPEVIDWQDGQVVVDPDYLAPRLGLTAQTLREGLRTGEVVGVTETGQGADEGKTRVVLRSPTRAWAAEILADGTAREIPPPRATGAAAGREATLADRVREYLSALPAGQPPVSYGALARALGLWMPGSVRRVTRALETTMREDAAANRPFIAARAAGRARGGVPAPGFFDLARALSRGPEPGETDAEFAARERAALDRALAGPAHSHATPA